jgi:uncharacterized membrane protein
VNDFLVDVTAMILFCVIIWPLPMGSYFLAVVIFAAHSMYYKLK